MLPDHPYCRALEGLLPRRLYILCRVDIARDGSMLFFKGFDVVTNQAQDMAVDGAALVIRHIANLFEHCFFNSDGNALNRHKYRLTIKYVFILRQSCDRIRN